MFVRLSARLYGRDRVVEAYDYNVAVPEISGRKERTEIKHRLKVGVNDKFDSDRFGGID